MLKRMYSLYDVKTAVYGNVMFLTTDGEAIRITQDALRDKNTVIANHAEDFRLDFIGTFDPTTGHLEQIDRPRMIAELAQLNVVQEK